MQATSSIPGLVQCRRAPRSSSGRAGDGLAWRTLGPDAESLHQAASAPREWTVHRDLCASGILGVWLLVRACTSLHGRLGPTVRQDLTNA